MPLAIIGLAPATYSFHANDFTILSAVPKHLDLHIVDPHAHTHPAAGVVGQRAMARIHKIYI